MKRRRTAVTSVKACALGLGCVVLGALASSAPRAFADGDPATSDVLSGDLIIPYQGYLRVDATGANRPIRMRFELYEVAVTFYGSAGTSPVWTEEQVVDVYNGRFSVGLGASTSLTSTVLDAQKVGLKITVIEDDGQGGTIEVPLGGIQTIEAVPHVAWSGHASSFDAAGDLSVAGQVRIGGDVTTRGDLFVEGTELSLGVDANGTGGGRALAQGPGDTLRLNAGGDFAGGVTFPDGSLTLQGDLTAPGEVELGSASGDVTFFGDLDLLGGLSMAGGELDLGGGSIVGVSTIHTDALAGSQGQAPSVTFGTRSTQIASSLEVEGGIRMASGEPIMKVRDHLLLGSNGSRDPSLSESEGFCYLSNFTMARRNEVTFPNTICRARIIGGAWTLTSTGPVSGNHFYGCRFTCVETSSR